MNAMSPNKRLNKGLANSLRSFASLLAVTFGNNRKK